MSVTPDAELVVAPAGYSLKATTPASLAACTSCIIARICLQPVLTVDGVQLEGDHPCLLGCPHLLSK